MIYTVSIKEIGNFNLVTLYKGTDEIKAKEIYDAFIIATKYTEYVFIIFTTLNEV